MAVESFKDIFNALRFKCTKCGRLCKEARHGMSLCCKENIHPIFCDENNDKYKKIKKGP